MKITVKTDNRRIAVWIPNFLLNSHHFLAFGYWFTKKTSGRYSPQPMPNLSATQLKPLCRELKRIKKRYGSYELIEVHQSEGDHVQIML
jgi:hypothetical protein